MMNPKDCFKHAGQGTVSGRRDLDDMMRELPNNQSGAGRHKCPYCAYQLGYKSGYSKALDDLKDCIIELRFK